MELLPFLPELLADLFALGGSPADDADLVASHVPAGRIENALELGSGKGAVSIALAERLGCSVLGIDGMARFVADANERAAAADLAGRCRFVHGDLRELTPESHTADLVVLAGLGPLFGNHADTVRFLGRFARPDGWILIADGYLRDRDVVPVGCEAYADRELTLERLQSHGATLVAERIYSAEETRAENARITHAIRARAEALAARDPEAAELVRGYVARQEHWDGILGHEVVCATWLLQRSDC
jgi:SAM-dependent methyltransferase